MFPGYEIIEELGRGGMGVVYRARQRSLDRLVAIKVLNIAQDPGNHLLKRFRLEGLAMKNLSHPAIIRLFDLVLEGDSPYLVMEYVEGGESLMEAIDSARWSWQEALDVAIALVSGLAYLHERGILHRDLKPNNVLVDRAGHPRLIDFGLARDTDPTVTRVTVDGQVIGTPAYMPLEQARGEPVTARSDVYSLGLLLMELFAARRLVSGEDGPIITTRERYEGGVPSLRRFVPAIPGSLDRLLTRCTARTPQDRPADARPVLVELDRIAQEVRGRRVPLSVDLQRQLASYAAPPRRVWPVPLAVLLLIGVLFALRPVSNPVRVRPDARVSARVNLQQLATILDRVVGPACERLEPLLVQLRSRLMGRGSHSVVSAVEACLGSGTIANICGICAGLSAEPKEVKAIRQSTRLLGQLGGLAILDELAESMGQTAIFAPALDPLRGHFAIQSEFGALDEMPVYGYLSSSSFKEPVPANPSPWIIRMLEIPDRYAQLSLILGDFDPKTVLEVTVNASMRIYFRNRSATAGGRSFHIPAYIESPSMQAHYMDYTPAGPFPHYVVLARALPKGCVHRGDNRLSFRFLHLPGALVLPPGRQWTTSLDFDNGSVWHAFISFLR